MKISIKKRKLKNNKTSLYLQFYKGYSKDIEGKIKHDREFYCLELYIFTEPQSEKEFSHNDITLGKAETIRNRYQYDYANKKHLTGEKFIIPNKIKPFIPVNLGKLILPPIIEYNKENNSIQYELSELEDNSVCNYECFLQISFSRDKVKIDYLLNSGLYLSSLLYGNNYDCLGSCIIDFKQFQKLQKELKDKLVNCIK